MVLDRGGVVAIARGLGQSRDSSLGDGMKGGVIVALAVTASVLGWSAGVGVGYWLEGREAQAELAAEAEALEAARLTAWDDALAKGMDAAVAAQTAYSAASWGRGRDGWDRAIALLELVPEDDPNYGAVAAKIEEYQGYRAVAVAKVAEQEAQPTAAEQALENFRAEIGEVDPQGALVLSAQLWGERDSDVVVVMSPTYHALPAASREDVARGLWERWAGYRSPGNIDGAYIRLENTNGRHVGGSRPSGGSVIWVE